MSQQEDGTREIMTFRTFGLESDRVQQKRQNDIDNPMLKHVPSDGWDAIKTPPKFPYDKNDWGPLFIARVLNSKRKEQIVFCYYSWRDGHMGFRSAGQPVKVLAWQLLKRNLTVHERISLRKARPTDANPDGFALYDTLADIDSHGRILSGPNSSETLNSYSEDEIKDRAYCNADEAMAWKTLKENEERRNYLFHLTETETRSRRCC